MVSQAYFPAKYTPPPAMPSAAMWGVQTPRGHPPTTGRARAINLGAKVAPGTAAPGARVPLREGGFSSQPGCGVRAGAASCSRGHAKEIWGGGCFCAPPFPNLGRV